MATSYPTSVDAFTNPTSSDPLTSPDHAAQHANINDAVEAIETAIGTTAAPVLAKLASPTFTGTVTIPSGASIADYAPLASPTFTGVPAAPTAAVATNTTQLATTALVIANAGSGTPKAQRASTMGIPGVMTASQSTGQSLDSLVVYYNPIVVTTSITITSLSLQCFGAGAAGSGARLSIYNSSSGWVPTTLVLDAGTVALTSTGTKTISSLSTTLTPGNYFFRVQADDTAGTRPTMNTIRGHPINWQWLNDAGTQFIFSLKATAASYTTAEATVTNLPVTGGSSSSPFVQFMKADWT